MDLKKKCRMHLWVPPIATRKNCGLQAAQKNSRPHHRLNGNKIIRGGKILEFFNDFWQDASLGTSDSLQKKLRPLGRTKTF